MAMMTLSLASCLGHTSVCGVRHSVVKTKQNALHSVTLAAPWSQGRAILLLIAALSATCVTRQPVVVARVCDAGTYTLTSMMYILYEELTPLFCMRPLTGGGLGFSAACRQPAGLASPRAC